MKKTYKNPTLKVVKVKGARLMQASANVTLYGKNATGTGMGREAEFSDWDEDE